MKVKTLYNNKWISLKEISFPEKGIGGYVFSHETRCDGNIVSILPYRLTGNGMEFLLRREITPCWHPTDFLISSITGGVDPGNTIQHTVINELEEEAGYSVDKTGLISLGTCHGAKSSDTVYHLYSVDLTGFERHEASGDGSALEENASCIWVKVIGDAVDPLVYTLHYRLTSFIMDQATNLKKKFK